MVDGRALCVLCCSFTTTPRSDYWSATDRRERCFWWLRKLSAFARAAGDTRCIRALAPLEWVSLALPEQARVVGDDEVAFAASANSGD